MISKIQLLFFNKLHPPDIVVMVICVGLDDVGSPVSSLKKNDPILYNDSVTMRKGNGSLPQI